MSFITDIATVVPENVLTQEEFYEQYAALSTNDQDKRKLKFLLSKSAINKRHCVQPDLSQLLGLSIDEKLELYHDKATDLAEKAAINNPSFHDHKNSLTDIVLVSCTGMQAPGIEIDLINRLGLPSGIRRYNINFMGCYAALTALRLAHEICQTKGRKVLIVSVELCSIHFQNSYVDDYLLSNSLFADGAASVIVSSEKENAIFEQLDFESRLIKNSIDEMSGKSSPSGFLMTLSAQVPKTIKESLRSRPLFNLDTQEVDWAIHPGGKQIVEGIKTIAEIDDEKVSESYHVLKEFGNMSSATVLFVLNEKRKKAFAEKKMIACAFGPGLTLEGALLKYV